MMADYCADKGLVLPPAIVADALVRVRGMNDEE